MVVESVAQEVGGVESAGCGSWASNPEYGRRPSNRHLHTPGMVVEGVVQEVGAVENAGCGSWASNLEYGRIPSNRRLHSEYL